MKTPYLSNVENLQRSPLSPFGSEKQLKAGKSCSADGDKYIIFVGGKDSIIGDYSVHL